MGRIRLGGIIAVIGLLFLASAFLIVRIPGDAAAVVETGPDSPPRLLRPGFHFRPIGSTLVVYGPLSVDVTGTTLLPLPTGGSVRVPFSLEAELPPEALPGLHSAMRGRQPEEFLRSQAELLLTRFSSGRRPVEIALAPFREEAAAAVEGSMQDGGIEGADMTVEPIDAESLLRLAEMLAPQEEAWELRPAVTDALAAEPADWRLHTALGLVNESERLILEAETSYIDALGIDPMALPPMERLVQMYTTVGEWNKLDRILSSALASDPTSLPHLNWMGLVLMHQGDDIGAERFFRDGLELAPEDATLLSNMGTLKMKLDQTDEAIALFRRAVDADAANIQAIVNLGSALAATDRFEEALSVLERAERTGSPLSPRLARTLALVHRQLGNTAKAEAYEQQAGPASDPS